MDRQQSIAHCFFDTHLIPNYKEWEANTLNLRLAMNASLSLFHMADHFWHSFCGSDPDRVFNEKNFRGFHNRINNECKNFRLLRDVANAHKHMKLDRSNRAITLSEQTSLRNPGYGESGYGSGPYGGGLSIVIILDDGTQRHLADILQTVKSYWHNKLYDYS